MIVVNLFGGPGSGKSTGAAYVYSRLKMSGINCELVTEVAKDYVWDESNPMLRDQLLVLANQFHRLRRLDGKVDVAITDSPVILSMIYTKNDRIWNNDRVFKTLCQLCSNTWKSKNYLVKRWKPYSQVGRVETEAEAKQKDSEILDAMNTDGSDYRVIDGNSMGYEQIVLDIIETLKQI